MTSLTPQQVNDLQIGLLHAGEEFARLYEFAEGQRAVLERRGWSPAAAESLAAGMLQRMLATALGPKP